MFTRRSLLLQAAAMGGAGGGGGGLQKPPVYGEAAPNLQRNRYTPQANKNVKVNQRIRVDARKNRARQRGMNIFNNLATIKDALDHTTDARTLRMAQLTNQIFAEGATFVTSACNITFVPDGNPATPEVAFVGRSHVGKTALLRSLFKDRYAVGQANTRKRKDAMSFFNVGDVFNVVECPGYGSQSCPFHLILQHAALIRNFVRCRPSLKMLYYCLDVSTTYGLSTQDVDILKFLSQEVPNFTIILTKGDKLAGDGGKLRKEHDDGHALRERSTPENIRSELALNGIHHPMLVTSAFHMGGLDTLRYDIVSNALHALPTEMLTLTEARRLSLRLLSQKEIATIRPLQLAPTERDDEEHAWRRELAAEKLMVEASAAATASASSSPATTAEGASAAQVEDDDDGTIAAAHVPTAAATTFETGAVETTAASEPVGSHEEDVSLGMDGLDEEFSADCDIFDEHGNILTADYGAADGGGADGTAMSTTTLTDAQKDALELEIDELLDASAEEATGAVHVVVGDSADNAVTAASGEGSHQLVPITNQREALAAVEHTARATELSEAAEAHQRNYLSLVSKLDNKDHLAFVRATSPWRNPLMWPANVVPTRSLRHNIMRCPADPSNPYLTQPRFVAPRMDMYFRRPTFKVLRGRPADKGIYHADENQARLDKAYTIPYFPTIVDVNITPKAQHFVGINNFFAADRTLRLEGLLALKQLRDEIVNPLGDTSTISNPMLKAEVEKLEFERYVKPTLAQLGGGINAIDEDEEPVGILGSSSVASLSPTDGTPTDDTPADASPTTSKPKPRIAFLKPKQ